MSTAVNPDINEIIAVKEYTERAYLDYSMYVILDRALPHISDGLKPVQRRIIYAMSELGLSASAKYKKSARTVGDVLGKFHPHGDTACYEAMVHMAQPFAYRYPLVDGQGNWGSADDPKSFAAMRYTESRLSPYAAILLQELGQGTVDWQPNFDGTLDEPKCLPARLPTLLLNGAMGIAVGMSTDIPPHNLAEVADASIALLENPDTSVAELCKYIKGPDLPSGGEIITPRQALLEMYQQGRGSYKVRATYEISKNGDVIIDALPYQVSPAKILEQIAQQMQTKKLPMVADLRDESDHEQPIRLVVVPRDRKVSIEQLMSHLFATTDLEKNYRVNMNIIGLNGKPQVKDLRTLLQEWLTFRTDTVRCRLQHRLDKVLDRLHILEGYLTAYLNIDEVLRIIRYEDHPKQSLIDAFKISERQAEAILELKLRQLAKLEEIKIQAEQKKLDQERKSIERLLKSKKLLTQQIIKEIEADKQAYQDTRRSKLVKREEAKAANTLELISADPVTVILSEKGWVRSAKGQDIDIEKLSFKSGDQFLAAGFGKNNEPVIFMDSDGRCYTTPAHTLPSARGYGEPLSGRFSTASGAHFINLMMGVPETHYVLGSSSGYGFITQLEQLITKNKAGKAVLKLSAQDAVIPPHEIGELETDWILLGTAQGRLLMYPVCQLPILNKGKGNKLIQLDRQSNEDALTAMVVINSKDQVEINTGTRSKVMKFSELKPYKGERGQRGVKLPRGYPRVSDLFVIDPGE